MKTITINEEQFAEAVSVANEKFRNLGDKKSPDPTVDFMMGLQNMLFGAILTEVLFEKETKEDK